ncbi:MAG: type IV secretion system DNA-binding domain-containing protein, partial [Nitrospinota bacterium]
DKIYSSSSRQSIVNACGSSITFGVSEPDTAKLLSDQIGEQENMRTRHSVSGGLPENRDGYSYTSEQKIEKLVIPSELMDLQSLEAYLKISGYPLIKGKLNIKKYIAATKPLLLREEVFLKNIQGKKMPDTTSPKEKVMTQEQKKDYFQIDLPET